MQTHGSSNSDDGSVEPVNKDAAAAEKEKLLREIQELKSIIKQCEWNLQTLRFKDVEERVTERHLPGSPEASSHFDRTLSVEVDLQNDLYRFAGFRCVRFRRDEFVFNFTSTNGVQKDNTHAVQIFVKDGKGNLGKWVMPMSIDMNYILSKTPIDELKNLTAFIKNCKHNVNCHSTREEQFLSLKKGISHMKHCNLQSDIGFKQISLELYGIHDSEHDRYMNLIINLFYYSDKARPHKIEVDTADESKLSDGTRQKLKLLLKEFKISDLQTAFNKILAQDNSTFTWMQADDSESPLELNDTSSSDEEDFLVQLQSDRKRSLRKLQKRRELRKKWNERKRQRDINNIGSEEDNNEDSHSKTKVSRTESPRRIPIRKKEAKKAMATSKQQKINNKDSHSKAEVSRIESPRRIPIRKKEAKKAMSISKQEKINKNLLEETTPLHEPKVKLRQTKLNFQTHEATNSNTNEISLFESKVHNRSNSKRSKIAKLITSTPLRKNLHVRIVPLSPSLEITNITSIGTTKKTANKLNDSKNSDLENKKTPEKKTQEKNNRLLRSVMKTPELSSQVLKTNQCLTRSMTK